MAQVLIVDDEKSIRRTLGEFLREAGYAVVEAEDADAAQQRLAEATFDVVVTDIILPRISGVELLRRIQDTSPDVQVVMMTGEPTVETATEALRAGAADYLFKPISKAAILRAVANAARLKSLSDAKQRLEAENRVYQETLERMVQERTAQLTASEEHARQLSRFNQCILDALTANICVLGEEGVILAVNEPWRTFALANPCFPRHADVGANYLAVCDAAQGEDAALAQDVAQGLRAVTRGETREFSMEYPCHSPDTKRWFMLRATRFADNGPVRVVVAHVDISARKYAEQRITDALNFSRTIIESSPIGIISYQATGEAVSANSAMAQIIGATREQLLAQNFRQLESWKKSGLLGLAERALGTQAEQQAEVQHESTFGKRLDLSCRFVPFSYANQPHLLLVAADVTEQRLTQAKLLRAQRVESIGSLASGIAHDLNNILTPILMCAPMLQMEETDANRRDLAQTVESSAKRAVGIVKQLLSFARGKEGQKQPVQVRHLVRDMAKLARETFPRSIQIEEISAPDLWPVMADVTQLHQVFLNLCVNARDAMPTGGRLTLRAENVTLDDRYVTLHSDAQVGPYVRIQIEDTGTGISESAQKHIFESFFTTKGEDQGTGLGLTTVQGIVKQHHGFISFTTATGKGTTFEVHLPAAPAATAEGEVTGSRDAVPRGHGDLVLIVDDEHAICDTTRRALEQHGYSVIQAQDGIEALAFFSARQAEIRAVITDYMMPLMDGVTLARTLRRLSPNTPLIVSSGGLFGKAGSEALKAFEVLGIQYVLHKPHTAAVLLKTLSQALVQSETPIGGKGVQ